MKKKYFLVTAVLLSVMLVSITGYVFASGAIKIINIRCGT